MNILFHRCIPGRAPSAVSVWSESPDSGRVMLNIETRQPSAADGSRMTLRERRALDECQRREVEVVMSRAELRFLGRALVAAADNFS